MMTEKELVNKYLGRAYSSDKFQCWDLVRSALKDLGHELVDVVEYVNKCPSGSKEALLENYKECTTETLKPQPYDVVLLDITGFLHAGLVLSGRKFLHASKAGVVVSRLDDAKWFKYICGFYRVNK